MIPEIVADGGAGFVVRGHVRQLVVRAEGFARGAAPMPPVMYSFLRGDVVPDFVDGVHVAWSPVSAATSAMPEYI